MNHRNTETQRAELNNLTQRVIGLCIEVHRELGPGLLVNFNVPALKDGVRRIASGELFKTGRPGTGQLEILALLLCASVSLWFKTFLVLREVEWVNLGLFWAL